jgi:hypothetical protein
MTDFGSATIMYHFIFLSGAMMLACLAIGLYFLKFWRRTGDRFFLLFALGFFVLGLNRIAILMLTELQEATATVFYIVRLCAYVLLLIAIIDKNRSSNAPADQGA